MAHPFGTSGGHLTFTIESRSFVFFNVIWPLLKGGLPFKFLAVMYIILVGGLA
jgi:hypothetical protein